MDSNLVDTLCIELTARCPLRCIHCSAQATPKRFEFLPAGLLSEQLLTVSGLREIYLSGGEPFEHPEFIEVVRAASQVAPVVVAYSSGTLLQNSSTPTPLPEQILAEVRDAGLGRIDFSLYSAKSAKHDTVTHVPGSFETTLESIRRAHRVSLKIGMHYVPMGENGEDVEQVASLSASLGASRFHILALTPQGRASIRHAELSPNPSILPKLAKLMHERRDLEIQLSSALRHAIGQNVHTERDKLRTAFLDVHGFAYPSEGCRTPAHRTSGSLLSGHSLTELLKQLKKTHALADAR